MAGNGTSFVKRPNTGSNVDMVVVNGYVYYTDTTAGNVDDMALLIEAAAKGGTGSQWEAHMLFADGSEKTVTSRSTGTTRTTSPSRSCRSLKAMLLTRT